MSGVIAYLPDALITPFFSPADRSISRTYSCHCKFRASDITISESLLPFVEVPVSYVLHK